jgi:RNA polymerase sigma-70 factor (ECF subfamily)
MASEETQDGRYAFAAQAFGPALERLAKAYEADPECRNDLLQDIHLALWRSFARFDERCSLRTWVYRVAHNVGASHILRQKSNSHLVSLDDLELPTGAQSPEDTAGEHHALSRLMAFIRALKPPDRQVLLLYLEDLNAAAIAEVTGLSPGAVAVRIHRAKAILAEEFQIGAQR